MVKEKVTHLVDKLLLIESKLPGTIQGYFALVSFLPVIVSLFILPKFTDNPIWDLLCIALCFFFIGCIGVISAIRRELPQFIPLLGRSALLMGIFLAVTSWSIALYAIYLMLEKILLGT